MHGRSNLNNIEMAYARQVKFATYMLIVHVLNNITLNSSKQCVRLGRIKTYMQKYKHVKGTFLIRIINM